MKKLVAGLIIVFLLFIACIYIFIPAQIGIDESVIAKVSPLAAGRMLVEEKNWHRWWPGTVNNKLADSQFVYNHSNFTIDQQSYNGFKIDISNQSDSVHSLLNLVPLHIDSLQLQWNGIMNASANPFKRLAQYRQLNEIGKDTRHILQALKSFLDKQENIYGIQISRELVKDTLLLSTKATFGVYPNVPAIYGLVNILRDEINKAGAKETNHPMLHVDQLGPKNYQAMVAIPVDKEILANRGFIFKRMVPGYILVADIKGGPASIDKAYTEMKNFMTDYSRVSIAIPFESMVTDRLNESDTSKWVTRIYFPVVL